MQTQTKPMTVDEWLVHDVPEGFRAELIDGVIEMTPLAGKPHQLVLANLIEEVVRFKISRPELLITWTSPCRFSIPFAHREQGREPDLGIYMGPNQISGPPAWTDPLPIVVAEVVSPDKTEAYRDHVEKRHDYHLAGIPEYWIVDFQEKLFLALRRTEQGWNEIRLGTQDTYTTQLLPGFQLQVAQLWT